MTVMTTKKRKTVLSWSSGKDSAYALYCLQKDPSVELIGIFTTINKEFERVAMHAVRVELLKQQAKKAGSVDSPLPLDIIELPFPCTNEDYQKIMADFYQSLVDKGIEQIAFGDLFLEDVRDYRIKNLQGTGLIPIFPLWGKDTTQLADTIIAVGIKAITTCIDPKQLDKHFCGQNFDADFLAALPEQVDKCGENGEFHTFVYDAPMFYEPIAVTKGEVIERDGFVFADVLAVDN